jgi:hypothetical protein
MTSDFEITEFSALVRQTIPPDRGWRRTFETVVECYERVTKQASDPKHYTLACIDLWRYVLADEHLRKSTAFTDGELSMMHGIITAAFAADTIPEYRETAEARLKQQFRSFEREFNDIMCSEINLYDGVRRQFVRYGVYALWRYGDTGQLRSPIPTYVGKSTRQAGMVDRIKCHWSWWDHRLMGVTFTEVDGTIRNPKSKTSQVERAMIMAIRPPANGKDWFPYE